MIQAGEELSVSRQLDVRVVRGCISLWGAALGKGLMNSTNNNTSSSSSSSSSSSNGNDDTNDTNKHNNDHKHNSEMGSALMGSLQMFMLSDSGTFWILPLTYFWLPKSARAYLFPQPVNTHMTLGSGPESVAPVCPQQGARPLRRLPPRLGGPLGCSRKDKWGHSEWAYSEWAHRESARALGRLNRLCIIRVVCSFDSCVIM